MGHTSVVILVCWFACSKPSMMRRTDADPSATVDDSHLGYVFTSFRGYCVQSMSVGERTCPLKTDTKCPHDDGQSQCTCVWTHDDMRVDPWWHDSIWDTPKPCRPCSLWLAKAGILPQHFSSRPMGEGGITVYKLQWSGDWNGYPGRYYTVLRNTPVIPEFFLALKLKVL
jgi:hypothetical protein